MESISKHSYGYGSGFGHIDGKGYGDSYGSGDGKGYGDDNGNSKGYGCGEGSGDGDSRCDGLGSGFGDGDGHDKDTVLSKPSIYLVQVRSGEYLDYHKEIVFATANKELADKWCDRYNRIINDNKERITDYVDINNPNPAPFWFGVISSHAYPPVAEVITVVQK